MKTTKTETTRATELIGRSLTRDITPEQINAGEQGASRGLLRTVEVGAIDEAARTVELAFSSTTPVLRWFGEEVLSHKRKAVKLQRLNDGGAVLVGHDWDDQVGVVEKARVDSDQMGRAVVRFGNSPRAQEIFQDIVDGIRRHVSVGYTVSKIEEEVREGRPNLVTITEWEPYEISIVSVPADQSVGVGRGAENPPEGSGAPAGQTAGNDTGADGLPADTQQRELKMNTIITRDAKGDKVRAKVDENGEIVEIIEVLERANPGVGSDVEAAAVIRGREQEQTRVRELTELGAAYDAGDLAMRMITEGKGVEDMTRDLNDHLHQRSTQRHLSDNSDIGLTDAEAGQFSFIRAMRALADPTNRRAQEAAAFEFEASDAAAQKMGRDAQGVMVPTEVLTRALNTDSSGSSAGDTGGFSVGSPLLAQSFIEMLRNRAVLMRLATPLGGLTGNPDIPTQESGASGYWIGENDDAPEDILGLGQRQMSPKTVAAYSEITRRTLKQSSLDVEALVRRDLASALALTIDRAGFYGSGAGNEPLGIKNTNGVNAIDFAGAASGGGVALPTWSEVIQMETEISADNADVNSMAYAFNARMRGHFKSTEKFASTSGQPIWENGNSVNGYRPEVTNQIANGDLFFGNFADLILGMWGGLDITVDPYTGSKKGRLRIVTMQDVDFVIRHAASFCYGSDAS
ncbi:phage major capsid protein [Parasedimentitalea psychrophila]|uniref:Phage major capsid protein n=1 Tax=Parasedimentitalea psychrophila TaxID=2997337 RepID=A0A9Y2KV81_9RHOB|nr:phage major capsid protein [Parasedimentitalea psychrophila]WIY23780.1 phage major capsid protein [Parasedimentitalea psychrophila]